MKITKRIAKEVHNEKVKSFDEGVKQATLSQRKKDVEEFIKLLKDYLADEDDTMLLNDIVKEYEQEIKIGKR